MSGNVLSVLVGVGAELPERVVRNTDEPISLLDTTDEWIRSRTGIERRRWVRPGESTGDLAVRAGRRALDSAGVADVDLVVVSTTTLTTTLRARRRGSPLSWDWAPYRPSTSQPPVRASCTRSPPATRGSGPVWQSESW